MPWIADVAADDHHIAGAGLVGADAQAGRHQAESAGVDVDPVAVAAVDHLGVARHQGYAGGAGGGAHALDDRGRAG